MPVMTIKEITGFVFLLSGFYIEQAAGYNFSHRNYS